MPKFVLNPLLPANLQQLQNNLADLDTKNHSDLDQLAWSTAGHTIDTDVDMATNDLLNVGTVNINSTIDHTITDSSGDLVITNPNSNGDIIFNINDGGASSNFVQIDSSEGLFKVSGTGAFYGTAGLFNIAGTMDMSSVTGMVGMTPALTGSGILAANIVQPSYSSGNITVIAFYMNPLVTGTAPLNLETIRTVAGQHRVGINDTIKMLTEQNIDRTFLNLGAPADTSTVDYDYIVLGGAITATEYDPGGIGSIPIYDEKMINLTGGATRTIYAGSGSSSINQYGIYLSGFGTQSGLIAGDSVYALYANGGLFHFHDNTKLLLGTADDSEIYYNGTDLIIDSNVVGSGTIDLAGQSASAITTETLSEYVTIKIGGVSKKIAIVA